MDGTTLDLIIIPIVAVASLAAGLLMVMWAGEHPGKAEPRRSAGTAEPSSAASPVAVPAAGPVAVPRQAAAPAAAADRAMAR
jgi:flagellar basal body-associated protein FliL